MLSLPVLSPEWKVAPGGVHSFKKNKIEHNRDNLRNSEYSNEGNLEHISHMSNLCTTLQIINAMKN